ncbi:MAG TPA: peptidoglycan-binding domain-containing protein, partial [Usitatibacter sp.]|nr:peptidoglycan-binding domain-containing protein [Usitatibacter sp.]
QRIYYTVVAYADDAGREAIYAQPPESLAREAPYVTLAADLEGALAFMFGTPVANLLRVTGHGVYAREQAQEEVGEDLEAETPHSIGLADADDDAEAEEHLGHAAAMDADEETGEAAAFADDGDLRAPVMEASEAAAAYDTPAALDDTEYEPDEPHAAALDDDYNDGYGKVSDELPVAHAAAQADRDDDGYGGQGGYGAEHEVGEQSPHAMAMGDRVPEMLPDEEAEGAHAAQAGSGDEDDVAVEGYGYAEAAEAPPAAVAARRPFDIEACKAILARIAPFESGKEGFARVIDDGEFAGRFGTAHPAHNRYHLGLTFGAFPFVQEHGTLGQLLRLMRERDAATFDATFPEPAQLIAVTTSNEAPHAWDSPDGYSPRLAPVAGQRLWQEPWLARFRRAGGHPPFQGAQNELAARLWIEPVRQVAKQLGLDSDQALTLVVDRAVQMGSQAGLAWVLEAATPFETIALRQRALAALGHADVQAFQTAQRLPITGVWDVATHAALIAALRGNPNSPSPVLGREEIVGAMLRHAQGTPWAERVRRLRDASAADRIYEL